jgi:hypothetical protein
MTPEQMIYRAQQAEHLLDRYRAAVSYWRERAAEAA